MYPFISNINRYSDLILKETDIGQIDVEALQEPRGRSTAAQKCAPLSGDHRLRASGLFARQTRNEWVVSQFYKKRRSINKSP